MTTRPDHGTQFTSDNNELEVATKAAARTRQREAEYAAAAVLNGLEFDRLMEKLLGSGMLVPM
jgi:hypothetical protein